MNPLDELGLRDIAVPPEPGWWPPAPGWWALAGLLGLLAWGAWRIGRSRRRTRLYRQAGRELAGLRERCQRSEEAAAALAGLSRWLRQVALLDEPSHRIAGLSGTDWLEYLDRPLGGHEFRDRFARHLLHGPYQRRPSSDDLAALFELCGRWLRARRRQVR